MRGVWIVILLIGMLFAWFPNVSAQANTGNPEVTVVIEFGNHMDMSYTVKLPSDNHTALKATELACQNLSLYFHYTWYSGLGGFVDQIGWEKNDYSSTGYYWHFLVWKNGSYQWEMSQEGASSVELEEGDTIAWIYTVDSPDYKPWSLPGEVIGHYLSYPSMRGDLNNSGVADGYILGNDTLWKFKSSSPWGFSSTPIFYRGYIFVADSQELYELNANGSLIWNTTLGASGYYGIASPVAYRNLVIVGTSDKYVRAFYINNGTLAWEHYIGADITSSPVVDIVDKYPVVFVATFKLNSTGRIFALNFTNGQELWNLTLMGSNYFGVPAVANNKIYVPVAGVEDNSYKWSPPYGIQCIDERGTYLWNLTVNSSLRSSPVLWENRLYFVTTNSSGNGYLYAVNTTNGQIVWNYSLGSSTSSPAINGGILFLADDNGYVYALRDDGNLATLLWRKKVDGPVKASVLYAHGKIVVVSDTSSSRVHVFSEDGTEVWNYTPEPENYILSSPILADSQLIIASNNGYLYALSSNATLPQMGEISTSAAVVGTEIKVWFNSEMQYQAILYYENVSGDNYHAIMMNYTNGEYVGYIPAQSNEGTVHYYITLVNVTGGVVAIKTTEVSDIQVQGTVPEFQPVYLPGILALLVVLLRRKL